ncbi:MAG: hypothetical protein AAGI17_06690 [Planctomycetota bacterium]
MPAPADRGNQPDTPEESARAPKNRRPWRLARRVLVAAIVIPIVAVIVIGRTPLADRLVLPALSKVTGLEIDASRVRLAPDLDVVIWDLEVRLPGVDGFPGQLLASERVEAELDIAGLITGRHPIETVELTRPRLRVSQSVADGSLPAAEALGARPQGSGGSIELPRIRLRGGVIELAEHDAPDGAPDKVIATVPIEGDAVPGPDETRLTLRGGVSTSGGTTRPVEIVGSLTEDGIVLTTSGFSPESFPSDRVPPSLRELYEDLDLRGRVEPRKLSISRDGSFDLELGLDGVAMSLPFTPQGRTLTDEATPLRLSDVTGELRVTEDGVAGSLVGRVDRLEYDVRFDWWGLTPESPFLARLQAQPFRLERDMNLFSFVPASVIEELAEFGPPQGEVEAEIWLRRGALPEGASRQATAGDQPPVVPDVPIDAEAPAEVIAATPDQIRLTGEMRFRRGGGAFEGFPYPLENLSGTATFNRNFLFINRISGRGPRGGAATASGWAGPFGATSEVNLTVLASGMPIDRVLVAARGAARGGRLESLMSQPDYDRLSAAGMIAPSALLRLESPAFDLGGVIDLSIEVHRPYGYETDWDNRVIVRADQLGILSERFPLPFVARDFEMIIDDDGARLENLRLTAISGGTAIVNASVPVGDEEERSDDDIDAIVEGREIPIDPLFIQAVAAASGGPAEADEADDLNVAALLPRLGLDGFVDFELLLGARTATADRFRVEARLNRASSTPVVEMPDPNTPRPVVGELNGTVTVDERSVTFDGSGILAAEFADRTASARPIPVELAASIELPEGSRWEDEPRAPPRLTARAVLDDADLTWPAEPLLTIVTPELAERFAELRAELEPVGMVDLVLEAAGIARGETMETTTVKLEASELRDVGFNVLGGRVAFGDSAGEILYDGLDRVVTFDRFNAATRFDGSGAGRLRVDGVLPLVPTAPTMDTLDVGVIGARFESNLTREIARATSDGLGELLTTYNPRGAFDADILISALPIDEERFLPDLSARGDVRPRTLTVDGPSGTARATTVEGTIDFDPDGGAIRGVRATGEGWILGIEGGWVVGDEPGVVGSDLRLSVEADSLRDDLIALLPEAVSETIRGISLGVDGSVFAEGAVLTLDTPPDSEPDRAVEVSFAGLIDVLGGSLDLGAAVTEADATIDVRAWSRGEEANPDAGFALEIAASRALVNGAAITDGSGSIVSGGEPGVVLVPSFTAASHGGRISGRARLEPDDTADADEDLLRYWSEIRLSNVRVAPLLQDFAEAAAPRTDSDLSFQRPDDNSRGQLSGEVTLSGIVGDDATRWGNGRLSASGGPILEVPFLTGLLEFSNLQVPSGELLDDADAAFYVLGNEVAFERISVLSETIELFGYGTLDVPSSELDLRFRSRSRSPIPVISTVLESIRDEIVGTRVRGTLAEPRITAESFSATGRVLGALLGQEDSDAAKRLREIERSARTLGDRKERGRVAPLKPDPAPRSPRSRGGGSGGGRLTTVEEPPAGPPDFGKPF